MRSLALATALALATSPAGCAMISANAPDPARKADEPPRCNDGKGAVAVDGLMSASLGIGTLAVAGESGGAAAIFALGALVYGVSAGVGNSAANKCRAANDDYLAYREGLREEARFGATIGGLPLASDDEEDERQAAAARAGSPAVTPATMPTTTPTTPPATATRPPPPPVAATRPPPPRAAAPSDDDDGGDAAATDDDDDDSAWSAFWKEVP
jgi:hypothetical protein